MKSLIIALLFAALAPNRIGTQDITVMSFNMKNSEEKVETLVEIIQRETPLVIGIQQCPSEGKALKDKLQDYESAGKGGLQVLYLKDALECGQVKKIDKNTIRVTFTLKDSGRSFDVFTTEMTEKKDPKPAKKILEATTDGQPSIILGNINASHAPTFPNDYKNPNVVLREKYLDGYYSSISTEKAKTRMFVYYSREFLGMHYRVPAPAVRNVLRFKK